MTQKQPDGLDYWQRMDETSKEELEILKQAQRDGETYVMFRHGSSTLVGFSMAQSRSRMTGGYRWSPSEDQLLAAGESLSSKRSGL